MSIRVKESPDILARANLPAYATVEMMAENQADILIAEQCGYRQYVH